VRGAVGEMKGFRTEREVMWGSPAIRWLERPGVQFLEG
jgi:hypothetical protein